MATGLSKRRDDARKEAYQRKVATVRSIDRAVATNTSVMRLLTETPTPKRHTKVHEKNGSHNGADCGTTKDVFVGIKLVAIAGELHIVAEHQKSAKMPTPHCVRPSGWSGDYSKRRG